MWRGEVSPLVATDRPNLSLAGLASRWSAKEVASPPPSCRRRLSTIRCAGPGDATRSCDGSQTVT